MNDYCKVCGLLANGSHNSVRNCYACKESFSRAVKQ